MNNRIIEDLVEAGIYEQKTLMEEDYNMLSKNNKNSSKIYLTGKYEDVDASLARYYKEIDTKGLTLEEVKLKLEIERNKDIRSIKKMVMFFTILTIVSIITTFLFYLYLFF